MPDNSVIEINRTEIIIFYDESSNIDRPPYTSNSERPDITIDNMDVVVVNDSAEFEVPSTPVVSGAYSTTPKVRKMRKSDSNPLLNTVLENLNSKLTKKALDPSPHDALGHFIVEELSRIRNPMTVRDTKHKILKFIMEAQIMDDNC
ncbi:uncharacterized protein LOC124719870 [Schistocerca piceifrons]|uniref:uncharacterized protein LOC124719870 n=1 Tax=Schistocerca piceifrons TaxID=274613 RepID=UPI001F5F49C8|nr:uncharacterized protein LOC124719870 [Schistocerca piceifrons]